MMEYFDLKKPRLPSEELANIVKPIPKPTQATSEPSPKKVAEIVKAVHPPITSRENVFLLHNVVGLKERLLLRIDGFLSENTVTRSEIVAILDNLKERGEICEIEYTLINSLIQPKMDKNELFLTQKNHLWKICWIMMIIKMIMIAMIPLHYSIWMM